jgi:hypothetical protein
MEGAREDDYSYSGLPLVSSLMSYTQAVVCTCGCDGLGNLGCTEMH